MKENDEVLKNYGINGARVQSNVSGIKISVDAGSTETRTHVWDANPRSGVTMGISSGYSVVTSDISSVQSQSDTLYDNIEIVMEDVTIGKDIKVFDKLTIVKGGLLEDLRQPVLKTSSNIGKGLQDTTYVNTIANIALRLYMMANTIGAYSQGYVVNLTLALPNEDVASAKRQEEVKSRMAGDYMVSLPRCNFSVSLKIYKESILLVDEAQAALGSWRMQNKNDKTQYDNVMIIDAGGRSVDLSIMFKGRLLVRGSLTGKFGGQKFIDLITEKYVNETGENMPSRDMVQEALDTGLLQDGNSTIDITEFISKAKEEIAASIANDMSSLLDANDLRLNQLNLVLCAGRLMGETIQLEGNVVDSLAVNIEKYVKKVSPNTYVGRLNDQFALVHGLSLARYAYDAKNAKK